MALGMKLEYASRGSPVNINVGELFREASTTVPVEQWNRWLTQMIESELSGGERRAGEEGVSV